MEKIEVENKVLIFRTNNFDDESYTHSMWLHFVTSHGLVLLDIIDDRHMSCTVLEKKAKEYFKKYKNSREYIVDSMVSKITCTNILSIDEYYVKKTSMQRTSFLFGDDKNQRSCAEDSIQPLPYVSVIDVIDGLGPNITSCKDGFDRYCSGPDEISVWGMYEAIRYWNGGATSINRSTPATVLNTAVSLKYVTNLAIRLRSSYVSDTATASGHPFTLVQYFRLCYHIIGELELEDARSVASNVPSSKTQVQQVSKGAGDTAKETHTNLKRSMSAGSKYNANASVHSRQEQDLIRRSRVAKFCTLPNVMNTLSNTFNAPMAVFNSALNTQVNSNANSTSMFPSIRNINNSTVWTNSSMYPLDFVSHTPLFCISTRKMEKANKQNTTKIESHWVQFAKESNWKCGLELLGVESMGNKMQYDYYDVLLITRSGKNKSAILTSVDTDAYHCIDGMLDQRKVDANAKSRTFNSLTKLPRIHSNSNSRSDLINITSGEQWNRTSDCNQCPLPPKVSNQSIIRSSSSNSCLYTHSMQSLHPKTEIHKYMCQSIQFWKLIDRTRLFFPIDIDFVHNDARVVSGEIFAIPMVGLVEVFQGYNTDK